MGKNVYSSEVNWAVEKDKLSGKLTAKEIMEKYGIKNKSQVEILFHSNLKFEEFQYDKFNSLRNYEVSERVINYLNEEQIQEKLGYLTPKKFGVLAA